MHNNWVNNFMKFMYPMRFYFFKLKAVCDLYYNKEYIIKTSKFFKKINFKGSKQ